MSRTRGALRFADAPAIVIFCALAAYLAAGLFSAASNDLRYATASAVVVETGEESLSGLAIPTAALRSEAGEDFVWVAVAGRLEKKTIDIIFTGEDFYLAAHSTQGEGLRKGDRVVTAGEDLYEGKIIT